jgi:hypothetical protein
MVRNARGDVTAMEPMVKIPGSSNTNLKNAVAARAGFKGAGFDKWRARWDLNLEICGDVTRKNPFFMIYYIRIKTRILKSFP